MSTLGSKLRTIPDFPKSGINFCDITSWLQDPYCVSSLTSAMINILNEEFTKVIAIDARGFIVGTLVAKAFFKPLYLARKSGKLPVEVDEQTYSLEYGTSSICLEKNIITPEDKVLIVDDLLATGGTINAVATICKRYNPTSITSFVWIELVSEGLKGREFLESQGITVKSIMRI